MNRENKKHFGSKSKDVGKNLEYESCNYALCKNTGLRQDYGIVSCPVKQPSYDYDSKSQGIWFCSMLCCSMYSMENGRNDVMDCNLYDRMLYEIYHYKPKKKTV